MIGRIVKKESKDYVLQTEKGIITMPARGKINFNKINLLVGDIVNIDWDNQIIENVKERKNELRRPRIANVDICLLVMSLKEPNFSAHLLDKNLSFIIFNKIKPIICFTKCDLITEDEKKYYLKLKKYYENIGIQVVFNDEITKIKKIIKDKVVVLTGQTGAGKSTLLNKLDSNLNLKTSPISKALNRGVHTTKHVQLFSICSSLIADTPGFSSLDLREMTKNDIKDTFKEFNKINCVYNNCFHINEKECNVKKAVDQGIILKSRYDNYVKFINEVKK